LQIQLDPPERVGVGVEALPPNSRQRKQIVASLPDRSHTRRALPRARDNCTPQDRTEQLIGGGRETRTPSRGYPGFPAVNCSRRPPHNTAVADNRTTQAGWYSASKPSCVTCAGVSCPLKGIIKRREYADVDTEGRCDQPVGKPGVLRQQRAVQVGANRVAGLGALEAAVAIVAMTFQHAS